MRGPPSGNESNLSFQTFPFRDAHVCFRKTDAPLRSSSSELKSCELCNYLHSYEQGTLIQGSSRGCPSSRPDLNTIPKPRRDHGDCGAKQVIQPWGKQGRGGVNSHVLAPSPCFLPLLPLLPLPLPPPIPPSPSPLPSISAPSLGHVGAIHPSRRPLWNARIATTMQHAKHVIQDKQINA